MGGTFMKRTTTMLIALLFCLFIFTGCDCDLSKNSNSQSTNDTVDTSEDIVIKRIYVYVESDDVVKPTITLLGDNKPPREEDAYINMYVFNSSSQAKSFQDGKAISTLQYNINYSTMGTQSCNGRIPMNGKQTIYLGFENERMRFHNYVWLEAIAITPKTEYFNAKYTIVR